MKTWLKFGIIALGLWIILTMVFLFSGYGYACSSLGISGPCYSPFQESLKDINDYIVFPLTISSSAQVYNYWGFLFSFVWGSLIGLVYSFVRKRW